MLRRFQNFKLGSLDARRLNDMQDAIIELQRRVDATPRFEYAQYGMTLARITTGVSTLGNQECFPQFPALKCNAAVYEFEEVLIRLDSSGDSPMSTDGCCSVSHYPGMLESSLPVGSSDPGLRPLLLDLNATSKRFVAGDVVPCFRARIDDARATSRQLSKFRSLYIVAGTPEKQAKFYRITEVKPLRGDYMADEFPTPTGTPVLLGNQYEYSAFYGALLASAPCARLTPRRLTVGDVVIASQIGPSLRCTVTVPFDVECVECGTSGPPTPASVVANSKDTMAAGIMLGG